MLCRRSKMSWPAWGLPYQRKMPNGNPLWAMLTHCRKAHGPLTLRPKALRLCIGPVPVRPQQNQQRQQDLMAHAAGILEL